MEIKFFDDNHILVVGKDVRKYRDQLRNPVTGCKAKWSATHEGLIIKKSRRKNLDVLMRKIIFPIDTSILYVDGGMNTQTGDEAWGCVVNSKGIDVISHFPELVNDLKIKSVILPVGQRKVCVSTFSDVKSQQNNGAELLSMLIALRIATVSKVKEIKSDSELVVKWWSRNHVNVHTRKTMDKQKLEYIKECGELRTKFESQGGIITKISGNENLADLGYH